MSSSSHSSPFRHHFPSCSSKCRHCSARSNRNCNRSHFVNHLHFVLLCLPCTAVAAAAVQHALTAAVATLSIANAHSFTTTSPITSSHFNSSGDGTFHINYTSYFPSYSSSSSSSRSGNSGHSVKTGCSHDCNGNATDITAYNGVHVHHHDLAQAACHVANTVPPQPPSAVDHSVPHVTSPTPRHCSLLPLNTSSSTLLLLPTHRKYSNSA
jgi:hypothetical protein